jgi:hypothetical protein
MAQAVPPSAAPSPPAATAEEGDATADAQAPLNRAVRVVADGLALGDFALESAPSAEHPRGVVTALGWPENDDSSDLYAVSIDVATARELTRVRVGLSSPASSTMIASAARGVIIAAQGQAALTLTWVDAGSTLGAHRSVPGLGTDSGAEMRGFAAYDDRLVIASTDTRSLTEERVTVRILDGAGRLVSSHACHGGLFAPGMASLARIGDEVALVNLTKEYDKTGERGRVPICAGRLHGPPAWREAKLAEEKGASGLIVVRAGVVYFDGGSEAKPRALDESLHPTGPEAPPDDTDSSPCTGLTGTARWQEDVIGGARVVHMISCCGDRSPDGLFVCEGLDARGVAR